ncbi:uncharacterized protein PGTG_22517 [Puccinia graminis f. sp. tritici CRL 75-36-700-3]|uniref:BED-type domain-containing protein n=1 Tax=Puccinia graminis f. sp. tritici (strain CRL 75-36-700-3 / race SCCL) TaxID=418459 RepID=H6QUW0_PUCGT|nr:uncharacterized protein PGTG_22517 [Puccinia graminis f. sp. tritici CRL 75-36-700-3]EHS64868.1 hypothetical protein PGTG_22517 [Puccinia graminis f. sp. tritici CRL 75-36-700-3]
MKRKHSQTQKHRNNPPTPDPTPRTVIEVDDNSDTGDDNQSKPGNSHRSWVWNHLKPQGEFAICQAILKNGKMCGSELKRDKSASTKNLHGHLKNMHRLSDPKLVKKANSQIDIEKWAKNSKFEPKVELNKESLKTALVYFIADCDLSFSIVEKKSFHNLIRLVNEDAMPLMDNTCRTGISNHLTWMHMASQENIKMRYLAKQDYVSFTEDAWTAPNYTAFMAVTAHFITEKFEMVDLTIAIPNVRGKS